MPSNHFILCRPLLLQPSIFPSIRVFSNESVLCIKWPKYWSFSFSISPSNKYSGLISFRIDRLDLLVGNYASVKTNLKSPCSPRDSKESSPKPQFKSINSSALSFLYSPNLTSTTTRKTIALTRRIFVGKVMSLLFNMLSRLEKEVATPPVFLPGESHGWRSLVGYSPQDRKESDTTEQAI